ncbi:hypothetical protein HAALTHF_40880n [Vreelandella aquamarina]|nr:hypothetical protein HAALTHF_40880n [Halomonas axialensis]
MNRRRFFDPQHRRVSGGAAQWLWVPPARLGIHATPASLEGDDNSALAQQLRTRLQQLGTEVESGAPWRVTLGTPSLQERRIGTDGRASREHELTLSTSLSVQQRETNAYALNNATLSTSTRIRVSDDDLLNRETLFQEAEQTLTRQLAQRIVERLANLEALR